MSRINLSTCFLEQLSDKDLAYLEERIKRSSKNRPSTAPSENTAAKSSAAPRGAGDSADGAKKNLKEEKKPAKSQMTRLLLLLLFCNWY